MLLSPRAGPTCAHRCSVLARSRQTRIVRLSLRGWEPEGGHVYLVLPGAHFRSHFPLEGCSVCPRS